MKNFLIAGIKKIALVVLGTLVCITMSYIVHAEEVKILIIANKSVAANAVKASIIKKVFLGNKSSLADGSKVIPVVLKSGDAHKTFLKEYIGKSESAFRNSWKKLIFTGKGTMPKSFDSEEDLVSYVTKTEGAIGYISANTSPASNKIITVNK